MAYQDTKEGMENGEERRQKRTPLQFVKKYLFEGINFLYLYNLFMKRVRKNFECLPKAPRNVRKN